MGQRLSKPPLEEEFRHALSRNGRYLAKDVEICWKADERGKVSEVRVVFVPREHLKDDVPYARVNAHIRPCLQCVGNSSSEAWLTPRGHDAGMGFWGNPALRPRGHDGARIST